MGGHPLVIVHGVLVPAGGGGAWAIEKKCEKTFRTCEIQEKSTLAPRNGAIIGHLEMTNYFYSSWSYIDKAKPRARRRSTSIFLLFPPFRFFS